MKASEVKEHIAKGEPIRIIDVREGKEFSAGDAIPGAENIPMGEMFLQAAQGILPKDQKIVAVCKSGARCEIVARELREKGYDIDYLEGGMAAWGEY